MIPNPSFEDYSCCPTAPGQMDCVNGWSQASAGTIDYLNLCGWTTESFYAPSFPIPDGSACLRLLDGWLKGESTSYIHKEYAGVCLNYPMVKDSLYLFELYVGFRGEMESPDFNLSFYGTNDCSNLPFSTGEEYDCPLRYSGFNLLTSNIVSNGSGNIWKKVSVEIRPDEDIYAIVVGPDCVSEDPRETYVYYLDNFILNEKSAFDFQPLESTSPCSPNFTFAVTYNSDFAYQWYKDGIALVGETDAELSSMHGEGRYQLRIINGADCRISDDYIYAIPVHADSVSQTICEGDEFLFGDNWLTEAGTYIETFVSTENCDSIVTLNLELSETPIDTLEMNILKGAVFEFNEVSYSSEGVYPINFTSVNGCDSLVVLQLSVSNLIIPNAFSPNGDGVNDIFRVFVADEEIAMVTISIYNRWGERIFEGDEWDGKTGILGGEFLQLGVFVYVVEVTTIKNEKLFYTGNVTLIS